MKITQSNAVSLVLVRLILLMEYIKLALYGICHSQENSPSTQTITQSKWSIVEAEMFDPEIYRVLQNLCNRPGTCMCC